MRSRDEVGTTIAPELACFAGGGEMGARMRAIDWASTDLGPVDSWPQSLKTCVRIVLTSAQPMFVWWGDRLINLYNDAYKSIVGGKHPLALGQAASEVWQEIWDEVGPRAESTLRGNEGTYDEALLLIMERNGYPEETYYTFSYSPVPNDQGGIGGLICANTDDTQRIIGERQLALLRELAACTADARSVADACGRAASALATNPRDLTFALIYLLDDDKRTLTRVSAIGIEAQHAAAPAHIAPSDAQLFPMFEVIASQELRVVSLAGVLSALPAGAWERAPHEAVVMPIPASGQTGYGGVLVFGLNPFRLFDSPYRGFLGLVAGQIAASIASADAYEQERRRAEELAALDRAKTTFFSNISHEFRTPLTLMLGPLEDAMASSPHRLSPENLELAYRNALRLLKLVNALLDFSRIEAGRAEVSYEATDLSALTKDLLSAFRAAIERAGLAFEVELEPLNEPVYVDRDMWEKIVMNLLSNALKFTFEGSISVSLRLAGENVELRVRDTGIGIPEREQGHVFERFHQVQGARARTHEGSGIGLAMVHELVRLHGGTICVSSELGVGTLFVLSLPRGSKHLPQERLNASRSMSSTRLGSTPYVQEAARWLPASGEHALPSPSDERTAPGEAPALPDTRVRIVLVDDNSDMREYVERLLLPRWQVECFADGAAALTAVKLSPPDLVISDVMMPVLDGFGLLRALRADPSTKHVPVIMLSARAGEESRVEGIEAGADDYLVKPFSARELLARVTAHITLAGLRASAERERGRLYDVFMQAPVPVAVLTGPELRFEVANGSFCNVMDKSQLIGRTVHEAFAELRDHPALQGLEQVLHTGMPLVMTEAHVPLLRHGQIVDLFFNYAVQPLLGLKGEISGVIAVVSDVTEQVHARRKVESLRAAAEQASRAKDEFLSTLSHELRTPLSAIVGWSTLLRKGAVPAERMDKALETIERNAKVQARLIEDMLDLSRIEQGKLMLSVGPLELVRVVRAAIEAVGPAADAKGVRIQPVLDSHATIVGDADRLQQVVWNLLSNAIKFTPKGGRVHVRLQRHHSYVELAVADTGQGIEADFLPHVFDRFRQADASFARRAGGLGLGLAIVRSLVELHGGTVQAESEGRDRGALFVVKLPVAPLRGDSVPPSGERLPREASASFFESPPELRGLRLLVVDDEPETRELLKFVLEQCDVVVTLAESAREALAHLREARFDVLISDIGMPELDGYGLIRRVRDQPRDRGGDIPALALTAYARAEDRTEVLRAGFNMHLAKPIDPSELLVVITTLVNGYLRRR